MGSGRRRVRQLRFASALADGASPTPDRVISIGPRALGLGPSGRTELHSRMVIPDIAVNGTLSLSGGVGG